MPGNVFDRVDVYNPVAKTWRLDARMPTPRHGTFPLVFDGQIYVPGGSVFAGSSGTDAFEVLER